MGCFLVCAKVHVKSDNDFVTFPGSASLENIQFLKNDKDIENTGKNLEKNGHKCVFYLRTFPLQVSWCGNEEKCELAEDDCKEGILPKRFFKIKRCFVV